MAGTDGRRIEAVVAGTPVFVLVEPQLGENIGAAARAMWNFGLDRLRLVAPRDGWPNARAAALASGAGRVIDQAGLYPTTAEAVADLHRVYASTARPRDLVKPVLSPEAAMADARARAARGERIGILFGPERAGLVNADIVRAHAVISVPVNPAFASLNLAQCVLLLAYEWRRQGAEPAAAPQDRAGARPATSIEVERLIEGLEARLDAAGFFFPQIRRARMQSKLANLMRRTVLTEADIRTLHGVFRALSRDGPGRK
ncbi:RNA methyltransferase [soil metagenome]